MDDKLRQQAIELYDRFTHEGMERRDFFAAMTRIAGGAAAANLLIGSIAASPAAAAIVPADDKRLRTGMTLTATAVPPSLAATRALGGDTTDVEPFGTQTFPLGGVTPCRERLHAKGQRHQQRQREQPEEERAAANGRFGAGAGRSAPPVPGRGRRGRGASPGPSRGCRGSPGW